MPESRERGFNIGDRKPETGKRRSDHRLRRGFLALALMVIFASIASTAHAEPSLSLPQIDHLLEEMELELAEAAIAEHEAEDPLAPDTLYLRSRALFFEGSYVDALSYVDQAMMLSESPPYYLSSHRALVAATVEEVQGYAEHRTGDGHFLIYYQPGRDEVLVQHAEETLEAAYREIGADFGYFPPEPVRVEIYPRTKSLANVSSLSQEAIETSGTIALCKYNRLMVTSPRSLVRGYGWRDTLSHEYVHLVVQRLTGTRVPIWLHEGLAKFEESRWRGERRDLPPSNQDLLARRLEADNLVTFEQMHPSMALLPSQEDTGTAFAEVYTVVEYLTQEHGTEAIRSLVWAIHEGEDVEEAIETVSGLRFSAFVDRWERHLREREYRRLPSDFVNELQFMPSEADDEAPDDLAGIEHEQARDLMHLGQLLRARNRVEASITEYRKAEALIGSENPLLQNWLARALLDLDRAEEALAALGQAVEFYPSFYPTFLHLGEAHLDLEQPAEALPHLVEAASINPFDPDVHRQLSRAYTALGLTDQAELASHHLELVLH